MPRRKHEREREVFRYLETYREINANQKQLQRKKERTCHDGCCQRMVGKYELIIFEMCYSTSPLKYYVNFQVLYFLRMRLDWEEKRTLLLLSSSMRYQSQIKASAYESELLFSSRILPGLVFMTEHKTMMVGWG